VAKQFNELKDQFFVICYDTRGHGSSSTPTGPYTVEQLGEDVDCFTGSFEY
jgi:3-oxoadipate enol-lactonase